MPDLPDVTQTFDANAGPFLAAVDAMIAALDGLVAKTADVRNAMAEMANVADASAGLISAAMSSAADAVGKVGTAAMASAAETVAAMSRATSSMNDFRTAAAGATAAEATAAAAGAGLAASEEAVASAANRAKDALGGIQMRAFFPFTVPSSAAAKYWDTASAGWMRVTAEELAAADASKAVSTSMASAGAATAAAGGAAQRTYGWWGLTGNAIHWIVMGTLEIASTAIPALVALGAAAVAMAPAFTFIKDQMTNLVIASGSLNGAIRNSAAPLNSLAAGLGKVQQAAAPDAFIIFGSAISIVTSHMGVFSGVAAQAANVLASFASKLATELGGPMGQQLAGFFSNAIKYMIQWGQFLGNIGHTFVNVVNSMWGVGQLLLDVLNLISRALLAISSNPVGAVFIGLAAAMSAVYRYGQLLVTVFNWLGGSALVNAIKWAVGYTTALIGIAVEEGIVAAATVAMGDLMAAALSPIGIAIMAITAALGIWYLSTRHTADATQQLIQQVQSMPATVNNLSAGIVKLSNALGPATQHLNQIKAQASAAGMTLGTYGSAGKFASQQTQDLALKQTLLTQSAAQAQNDINALSAAIVQQQGKLAHLAIGLAQVGNTTGLVGANMTALSIATDLQDSKLQALNQAWDQYFNMLSGGMSTVAAFSTSLNNIGQVAGTTAQNLGTATGTMNLSVGQFAHQLSLGAVKGAAAWTNFSQITQSTIPQMIDWFRTANTAGAISSQNFSKSVLDMIAPLMKFANAGGPAAQAVLVGLAQAAGLGITSFPQLANAIKTNNASLANLNTQATNATIAMSQMNSVAKNLSNTLSVQEANAIANAALKASGFTTDIQNMMRAEQTHSTVGGLTWQQWAAKAARAQQQVQADAAKSVAAIQKIQNAENALHSKVITITVNTVYHTTGSASLAALSTGSSGGAKPGLPQGLSGKHGASGGYVSGPGTKTSDSIPAWLSDGEYVMRAAAVSHYGVGFMHALNAGRLADGGEPRVIGPHNSRGGFGGGFGFGAGAPEIHNHITVQLDGRVIAGALSSAYRTNVLTYARRNTGSNLNLRIR